jgi:hypothetical protein
MLATAPADDARLRRSKVAPTARASVGMGGGRGHVPTSVARWQGLV